MARAMTSRAPHALGLYESTIQRCFATKASRRRALGVSANALDPWERGTLVSPNADTMERLTLVADACRRLATLFSEERSIGEYLEGPVIVGVSTTRLELVLRARDPELPLKLAREEARAVAHVIGAAVPEEALVDDAWTPIIEALPRANRQLFDELRSRARTGQSTAPL